MAKFTLFLLLTVSLMAFLIAGCTENTPQDSLEEMVSPARESSGEPGFTRIGEQLALSWVEAVPGGHGLFLSRLKDSGEFGQAQEIASGKDWFVNWADRPSVVGGNGSLVAAHWLAKSDTATFAYDVWTSVSADGGTSWSEPRRPHSDDTQTEHGFVSLMPDGDAFRMVWLDGRETGGGHGHGEGGPMTLRAARLNAQGQVDQEQLLDERVCDCCPTDWAGVEDTRIVAYRDRSEEEVRDIYTVRFENGEWSSPQPVHEDGWKIHGCPVNGPALAVSEGRLACVWFTVEGETAKVRVAVSEDDGRSFSAPLEINEQNAIGRVDVEAVEGGLFLLLWMEEAPEAPAAEEEESSALIRARVLFPSGHLGKAETLVTTRDSRATGFPRVARSGSSFYLAWTEPGESTSQVRVLRWSPSWLEP